MTLLKLTVYFSLASKYRGRQATATVPTVGICTRGPAIMVGPEAAGQRNDSPSLQGGPYNTAAYTVPAKI